MNLDHIDGLLIGALPWLSMTLFPVLLILAAVFGTEAHRLGDENVHDVDDYKPAPKPADGGERRRLRPARSATPIHDEMAARPYVPLDDEAVQWLAEVWLRDIAADEQAKAGIYRSTADRDMTGAFPVVRAA